jgi:hypothetical protein
VFLIDQDCNEHPFRTLDPGEVLTRPSYDTNPWRIRSARTHRLIKEIPPLSTTELKVVVPREEMPDSPPQVCSEREFGAPVEFKIENTRDNAVQVYWVNQNCHEKPTMVVKPGETKIYATYVNHPFRIRDAVTNRLLYDGLPEVPGDERTAIP